MTRGIREEDEAQGDLFVSSSRRPAAGNSVIPFPQAVSRRMGLAERVGDASPSSSTHHFESLGSAVEAVVMRIRGGLPYIRVGVVGGPGGDEPAD